MLTQVPALTTSGFILTLQVLIDWINDVLVGERIIVKDLAEDLYDGQVLQKLFGKIEATSSLWNKAHRVPRVDVNVSLLFEIMRRSRFSNINLCFQILGFRKAGRWETERGRGDPVGDRPETEAADGSGTHQRLPETFQQEHPLERWL